MKILHINEHHPKGGGVYTYLRNFHRVLHDLNIRNFYAFNHQPGIEIEGVYDTLGYVGPITGNALEAHILDVNPDLVILHGSVDRAEFCMERFPTIRMLHACELLCIHGLGQSKDEPCEKLFMGKECITRGCATVSDYHSWLSTLDFHRKFDAIVFCSVWYRDLLLKEFGFSENQLFQLPALLSVQQVSKADSNIIVHTGGIKKHKGIEYLLRAVSQLKSQDWHLVLAGPGKPTYVMQMMRLASELGISHRVVFSGHIPHNEVQGLLLKAKLFVLPSILHEAYGFAGAEAMMHGIPIVAFDIHGPEGWMVDDYNGLIVSTRDTKALAEAIDLILLDSKLYCKFRKNALRMRQARAELELKSGEILNSLFSRLISRKL